MPATIVESTFDFVAVTKQDALSQAILGLTGAPQVVDSKQAVAITPADQDGNVALHFFDGIEFEGGKKSVNEGIVIFPADQIRDIAAILLQSVDEGEVAFTSVG